MLDIELSTRCTLACPLCPRTLCRDTRSQWDFGYIDPEIAKMALDDAAFAGEYVGFCGMYGDAIYHPSFVEICEYALARVPHLSITTNGSHRTDDWWYRVATLNWINAKWTFSIDGLHDTNQIYRINSDWDSIMRAIGIMSSAANRPTMEWKYIVFPYNRHQVDEAQRLALSLGFDRFMAVESIRSSDNLSHADRMLYDIGYHDTHRSDMP